MLSIKHKNRNFNPYYSNIALNFDKLFKNFSFVSKITKFTGWLKKG